MDPLFWLGNFLLTLNINTNITGIHCNYGVIGIILMPSSALVIYLRNMKGAFSKLPSTVSKHSRRAVQCPKRYLKFVAYNYGRWAPAINNENFHYWKRVPIAP
jgi:hypothetical protein